LEKSKLDVSNSIDLKDLNMSMEHVLKQDVVNMSQHKPNVGQNQFGKNLTKTKASSKFNASPVKNRGNITEENGESEN
jgi:hypothetical protein